MTKNDNAVSVKPYTRQRHTQSKVKGELTIVFQLIGSTKLLMTPAKVSAMTLVRPTMVGSRCIQASQALHGASLTQGFSRHLKSLLRLTWLERAMLDRND